MECIQKSAKCEGIHYLHAWNYSIRKVHTITKTTLPNPLHAKKRHTTILPSLVLGPGIMLCVPTVVSGLYSPTCQNVQRSFGKSGSPRSIWNPELDISRTCLF